MVGQDADELGRQLAALAATVKAQAEASAEAHKVHSARDDRLESKIDALLAQDRKLAERLSSVETTLRDGLVVARELGGRAAASSASNESRMREVERSDAEQVGRVDQMERGIRQSLGIATAMIGLAVLVWGILTYVIDK